MLRVVTGLRITQDDLFIFQTSDDYVCIRTAEYFDLP